MDAAISTTAIGSDRANGRLGACIVAAFAAAIPLVSRIDSHTMRPACCRRTASCARRSASSDRPTCRSPSRTGLSRSVRIRRCVIDKPLAGTTTSASPAGVRRKSVLESTVACEQMDRVVAAATLRGFDLPPFGRVSVGPTQPHGILQWICHWDDGADGRKRSARLVFTQWEVGTFLGRRT